MVESLERWMNGALQLGWGNDISTQPSTLQQAALLVQQRLPTPFAA